MNREPERMTRNERRKKEYVAKAESGENTKQPGKHAVLKARRKSRPPRARLHPVVPCGNPGCMRCYPRTEGRR